jgi:hypothetical protein
MKLALYLSSLFMLGVSLAEDALAPYATRPNSTGRPFPVVLPVYPENKAAVFDWKRYIEGSISEGDRVFRQEVMHPDFVPLSAPSPQKAA